MTARIGRTAFAYLCVEPLGAVNCRKFESGHPLSVLLRLTRHMSVAKSDIVPQSPGKKPALPGNAKDLGAGVTRIELSDVPAVVQPDPVVCVQLRIKPRKGR